MAGMVLGRYCEQVVSALLHAGAGSRALEARLEALDAEAELPWAEFCEILARAAASVHRSDLVAIGRRIVSSARPEFERWGFASAEAILTDLDAPFGAWIMDPPEHERLTTAKYGPEYAVFRAGLAHPAGLVEGYLRGIVEIHDGTVNDLACHRVSMDGRPYHLIELRWWTPQDLAVPRRRPISGPRMLEVA